MAAGYDGVYTNKVGKVAEGCATFWQTSRFRAAARRDLSMRELFAAAAVPGSLHARFLPLLDSSPDLVTALQRVGTIAQMVVLVPTDAAGGLESRPAAAEGGAAGGGGDDLTVAEDALCLVNTHLFYHPRAPHIRNMHVAAMLEEAAGLIGQVGQELQLRRPPALLFCGDLNSDLSDGIPGTPLDNVIDVFASDSLNMIMICCVRSAGAGDVEPECLRHSVLASPPCTGPEGLCERRPRLYSCYELVSFFAPVLAATEELCRPQVGMF